MWPVRLLPLIGVIGVLLFVSCGNTESLTDREEPVADRLFYSIDDTLMFHSDLDEWIKPLRAYHDRRMGRSLAEAKVPIRIDRPESRMGNLAADMLRSRATHLMSRQVDLALLDSDRFGMEWERGTITREDLYEWMPHEDHLVILEVNAGTLQNLAAEIAREGGVPVSGLRMVISGESASGILVRGQPVEPDRMYTVATTDALLASGRFSSFSDITDRLEFPVLVREMMISYVNGRGSLEPQLDGRIRIE